MSPEIPTLVRWLKVFAATIFAATLLGAGLLIILRLFAILW
jgi:hypothetical protein